MTELAQQRIRECREKKLKTLDLGNCGLMEIPEEVFELDWIESLNLGSSFFYDAVNKTWLKAYQSEHTNYISLIPDSIGKLKDLKSLSIYNYFFPEERSRKGIESIDAINKLVNLTHLSLAGNNISDIDCVRELINIKHLDIGNNPIGSLSGIENLKKMTHFTIWNSEVSSLISLNKLSNISYLYIGNNKIEDLSPIKDKVKIKVLNIANNPIVNLELISGLINIEQLSVAQCKVKNLGFATKLNKIKRLYIWNNEIEDLGPISHLFSIEQISGWNNPISNLKPIAQLKNIKRLIMYNCPIKSLETIRNLPNLRYIDVDNADIKNFEPIAQYLKSKKFYISCSNNPSINPPSEFLEGGAQTISEFFDQLKDNHTALNEGKIIFLGEGAAGKTSLIKRLLGDKFNPKESQTHGIQIRKAPMQVGGDEVLTRIWDFGGQEVMHATHQFFLSKRSVYVLVLDSRRDDKAEYWLKHAQSFGGDSPVLVVLNKIDENPSFEVNRKVLREKYPNIREFFRVSCADNKGIEEFRKALSETIDGMDLRRTPFPEAWLKVKEDMARMKKDFIGQKDYQRICKKYGVTRPLSQDVLLKFLHDLGIVIHFRHLKHFDTQVLNPLWLTNGVYRIINSPIVANDKGIMYDSDLNHVINDARYNVLGQKCHHYPADKLGYIVRIMQEFQLCFQMDEQTYIVPQLLPVEEPAFEFRGPVLNLRIKYTEFLPDSIFPRLMVQLNRYIADALRWRSGMILHKPELFDAQARVRADKEDKFIQVTVCGEERRRFLSFIRETVKEINKSFADLPYEELVPAGGTAMIKYSTLVAAEKAGRKEIFLGDLEKDVSVEDLLNGVEEPNMRSAQAQTPIKAFISYSHKDSDFLFELKSALSPLVRLNKLELWDDHAIEAGKEWEPEIMRQLGQADIVLCLVSSDFINSDFCWKKEFEAALAAHYAGEKTVVPIRLRQCNWEDLPIAKIQGLPAQWFGHLSLTERDPHWTEVSKGLRPAVQSAKVRNSSKGHMVE